MLDLREPFFEWFPIWQIAVRASVQVQSPAMIFESTCVPHLTGALQVNFKAEVMLVNKRTQSQEYDRLKCSFTTDVRPVSVGINPR